MNKNKKKLMNCEIFFNCYNNKILCKIPHFAFFLYKNLRNSYKYKIYIRMKLIDRFTFIISIEISLFFSTVHLHFLLFFEKNSRNENYFFIFTILFSFLITSIIFKECQFDIKKSSPPLKKMFPF